MSQYGGNELRQIKISESGKQVFLDNPKVYTYYFYKANDGEIFQDTKLASYTLYLLHSDPTAKIEVINKNEQIHAGGAINVNNVSLQFKVTGKNPTFLVAGTSFKSSAETNYKALSASEIKKVQKPWGYELWINGEHPGYALKEIFIKQGTRTSLQYHRQKQETNILFDGKARLYFKSNPLVGNDQVSDRDLGQHDLAPICAVDVVPNTLHRLEALTDVLLCETSTPHLDDVVRISDDAKRENGRIASEHGIK